MNTQSLKFLRKRKLAMVLPLLALPFLTLIFWSLGGGQANADNKSAVSGLDLTLPRPQLTNRPEDKLSLYELAEQKARKLQDEKATDPYSEKPDTLISSTGDNTEAFTDGEYAFDSNAYSGITLQESDHTEAALRKQLAALKEQMSAQPELKQDTETDDWKEQLPDLEQTPVSTESAAPPSTPVDSDPELQQLDHMLTKILDIEHPQRVTDRLQQESLKDRGLVFPVETKSDIPQADLLQPEDDSTAGFSGNAFYDSGTGLVSQNETAIPAVVHETQTLVSGATIKLRLTEAVFIGGRQIPSGTFVFGLCSLEGERLKITVKHIRYKNALLPVNLSVYDLDGLEGIRIPGAITRDAAKQGMTNGIQALDLYDMNSSLGARAASAGIQTVKSLLGNKAKLVKVTVRAGYPVLLMDNNKHNQ
jgi:conjugative transposon TraM protein